MELRTIRYLGNKRRLAKAISEAIDEVAPAGVPVIDLFSGTCSVGYQLKGHRPVISNDNQMYSFHLAKALIENEGDRPNASDATADLKETYQEHNQSLSKVLADELILENQLLDLNPVDDEALSRYRKFCGSTPYIENPGSGHGFSRIVRTVREFRAVPDGADPWMLFTSYFANAYFGLRQCIEIDAIRRALEESPELDERGFRKHVYFAAMIYTLSQTVSAVGHFAQFLKPTSRASMEVLRRERTKSVWSTFLSNVSELSSLVYRTRYRHLAICGDWKTALLGRGSWIDLNGSVVYADPPYTQDHYSRFYHVLDTFVRYDYPACQGVGRYRSDRLTSRFSFKRGAKEEFDGLVKGVSEKGSSLVISYSNRGVLSVRSLINICRRYYGDVNAIWKSLKHSNQGRAAAQCIQDRNVPRECLLSCSRPAGQR